MTSMILRETKNPTDPDCGERARQDSIMVMD
jgi:hypothetical protein